MIYKVIKILALINLLLQMVIHQLSVTDFFNRILIGISILILLLPAKWWPLYILPVLIMLVGLIAGSYLLALKYVG